MDVLVGIAVVVLVVILLLRAANSGRRSRSIPPVVLANLPGDGSFALEAVGESHYQTALRAIVGRGEVRHNCRATLILENDNPHDVNAVRIDVDGRTVAYLKRSDAKKYRRQVAKYGNLRAECDAVIVGGGPGRSLGIWLDLPTKGD